MSGVSNRIKPTVALGYTGSGEENLRYHEGQQAMVDRFRLQELRSGIGEPDCLLAKPFTDADRLAEWERITYQDRWDRMFKNLFTAYFCPFASIEVSDE